MPMDGFFLQGVKQELQKIIGCRVNRIHQPYRNLITMKLYGKGYKGTLLASTHSKYSRVHVTKQNFSNPSYPSSFCMLLRKFLVGGKITSVTQYKGDRILDIYITRTDEFDLTKNYVLTCELMGKHSNIILIDQSTNRIIDSIKRIQRDFSDEREVLPGVLFERPPARDKINPWQDGISKSQVHEIIQDYGGDYQQLLFDHFQGVSPFLSQNLAKQSLNETGSKQFTSVELDILVEKFITARSKIINGDYRPAISKDNTYQKYLDFYWDKGFLSNKEDLVEIKNDLSETLDDFSFYKEQEEREEQLRSQLTKHLKKVHKKARKKLRKQQKELQNSEQGEQYKKYGELLSANYHVLNGAKSSPVTVYDFYQDPPQEITIPIDTSKSPGENIENYFNKYNKCSNRISKLGKELTHTKQELRYLERLIYQVEEANDIFELENIREEIISEGYLKENEQKRKGTSKKKSNSIDYIRYESSDGFTILVGKNNRQNDLLTQKEASKNNTWMHVKEIAGSHVIVKGDNVPDNTLIEAAKLAAYHSKARYSENVPVDYTQIKHVRKPKGSKPGMVFYEHHKTLYVSPQTNDGVKKISG